MCKQSSRTFCKHSGLDRGRRPLRSRPQEQFFVVGAGVFDGPSERNMYPYILNNQRQRRRSRDDSKLRPRSTETPACQPERKSRNHPVSGGVFCILFAAVGKKYAAGGRTSRFHRQSPVIKKQAPAVRRGLTNLTNSRSSARRRCFPSGSCSWHRASSQTPRQTRSPPRWPRCTTGYRNCARTPARR